jgi:acetolactate synthase regulatory subunit
MWSKIHWENEAMRKFLIKPLLLALVLIGAASAQEKALDARFRAETIESVLRLLRDKYAYPEIALKMETAIREKQKSGEYEKLAEGNRRAEKLTADLRAVFDDKHLKISYSANPIPERSAKSGAPTEAEIEEARRQTRENFGLQKVEIMKGNVGLIVLNYFAPLDWSADVYAAALNTVANSDALIIDVRKNGGSMDIDTILFSAVTCSTNPSSSATFFCAKAIKPDSSGSRRGLPAGNT